MKKLNLIFLDIDGVMNNANWYYNPANKNLTWDILDPTSVVLLNNLLQLQETILIISSDWRKSYSSFDIERVLTENKVQFNMIAYTPILKFSKKCFVKDLLLPVSISMARGLEIKQVLVNLPKVFAIFNLNYEDFKINYVILDDDDSGILLSQKDNFVKINPQFGFNEYQYKIAETILMR